MQDRKTYFEELYETFVKQIFRFIYLRTNNIQIAEDRTSETFLRLWKIIERGKIIDNERALLYTIARGIIIDYYRSKKNRSTVKLEEIPDEKLNTNDDMIEKLYLRQQAAEIYAQLAKIKKEYQEIILLRFVEDLEFSEIAVILRKKETTVRVLLHRAIKTLKGLV